MLKRKREAADLLMSLPEATVAEKVGVRPATLRRWMREPEFSSALKTREREQEAALARIARQAAVRAAAALCQATGESRDPKTLIELLKLSGAYEAKPEDPAEALAQIVSLADRVTDEQLDAAGF